jgi:phage-related protein
MAGMDTPATPKPLFWIGSSRDDVRRFPEEVRSTIGVALYYAQLGEKHQHAKPLKGFRGTGVLEIVDDEDGETYRAVYTVRFAGAVYVLHAFQKKSRRGIKTAKQDIDLIHTRLRRAQEEYTDGTLSKNPNLHA